VTGILVWAYTLLLPNIADAGFLGTAFLANGPFGLTVLRPQALFGLDLPPLAHGVFWSLSLNILAFITLSLGRAPAAMERMQADLFVPTNLSPVPSFRLWRSSVTVDELTTTVARYLGEGRTRTSFEQFAETHGISIAPNADADFQLLRHAEHLLASAIGAASSRLVLSLLLRKRTVSTKAALKLLDDANTAIHYNREILQNALEHVSEAIAVFDKDMQLVCWNRQFGEILGLPHEIIGIGARLDEFLRYHAVNGIYGPGDVDALVGERMERYTAATEPFLERFSQRGLVVDVRANRMPDGGIVTTFTDITPSFEAAEALERRVAERTTELTRLNAELVRAKADAEEANVSKTRFLAAASHDILQPLNAARLYVTSLVERQSRKKGEDARLVANVDASLDAVEEIFGALLDISRLDTGVMKPELSSFRIDELLRQLELEFTPLAREKGLKLVFVPSTLTVRSDRRLLRRLLQNLVSNAIKYTPKGRVVIGCRRRRNQLRIEVHDTGLGIPTSQKKNIFREFHRLDEGAKVARGLGLGLSIVERIGRVLKHKVDVRSVSGEGSRFSVEVPVTAAVKASPVGREEPHAEPGQLAGVTVLCIDNEPQILDGMQTLLEGWGCRVLKAPDLPIAIEVLGKNRDPLSGLLVDYHLDDGNGIDAIVELRRRFGAHLPAILITADRSPRVREESRRRDVPVLHKPLKPAALRAALTQWRIQRVAAAE
jgi:signal transduction histidine kinase